VFRDRRLRTLQLFHSLAVDSVGGAIAVDYIRYQRIATL